MLVHPLTEKLKTLRFKGMLEALEEQLQQPEAETLCFMERLGLLIDRELTERDNRRLTTRLRNARLKQSACMENIDYKNARGLDKALLFSLGQGQWIGEHRNILIAGYTGTGKTYLACALAHKSCLLGYTAQYIRMPRLFQELVLAKGDGRYNKLMTAFAKIDVLILDDWGLAVLTDEQRRDLLEIIDDRHQSRSTIITSQLPTKMWHESIGDQTLADAIMDRIIHNAYKIELKGESMRKSKK